MRKSKLQLIKDKFYYKDGVLQLDHYGIFNAGLIESEIDDYLRMRANSLNIAQVKKRFNNELRGSTCQCVILDGKEYILVYRHDVQRFADAIFNGKKTYFD